ncbi:MAG: D-alanyl-D-alanine carboxypeptidase/D-alanyl-D-alanine-endopeptidase [Chitinophagales bacterium]
MNKFLLIIVCWFFIDASHAQNISEKLQKAYQQFESDSQLKHAISSLYVINAKTGKVVFDKNSQIGLVPASTQKIITATTAFELLGKDYRYKTEIGYDGQIKDSVLEGNFYIVGSGDPTFGSWRYIHTKRDTILKYLSSILKNAGVRKISKDLILDDSKFSFQPIPGGWIWDDIGNYYGAGTWGINWNENQYNLLLKPGNKEGDIVEIKGTEPQLDISALTNLLISGNPGSGDNGYIYLPPYSIFGFVTGTVPAGEQGFQISGSTPFPTNQLSGNIENLFSANNFQLKGSCRPSEYYLNNKLSLPAYKKVLEKIYSPTLDSIVYWFLQKSINLYGEALLKTFAYEKKGFGATDSGVVIVKDFWKQKGLDPEELNIKDGSGLSPQNRVTTHAQVEILNYAKQQSWFSYFFNALPEYNNMKMKSGSISDVKGFCGYQTSGDGTQYIFSFLVNNYSGSSSAVVNKMYKVLDVLK